jgi:hypothetical protein
MPPDGPDDLLDVGENRDRVRIAFATGHVAVRAAHRAARRLAGGDEVRRARVGAERRRFAHADHQNRALVLKPVAGRALVAVQAGNVVPGRHLDTFGIGKAGHHLLAAREVQGSCFVIDRADRQQSLAGR